MKKHFREQVPSILMVLILLCAATSAFAGVTISSPATNATVGSPVHFVASATSETARPITAMRIYLDYNSIYATSGNAINTYSTVTAGTHHLTIQAWDGGGTVYKSSTTFSAGSAPATTSGVTISSPTAGATVSSPVRFVASAKSSSSYPITAMQIYVDNVSVYGTTAGALDTNITMSTGSHYVVAQAWDSSGKVYKTPMNITVGTATAPPPPPNPTQVSVAVSPTSSALQVGRTQQFNASVSGSTNTAVTWTVNGVTGGNSIVGTVSTSGLYTAPGTAPSGGSVTVAATSAADTTKSASAAVTIAAAPASTAVSVSVTPTSASMSGNQSQQFNATVSGTTNTGVTWSVNGVQGGSATYGTISSSGLYTSPACPGTSSVTVSAQSAYDSSASAKANVTLGGGASGSGNYYVATNGSDSNDGSACRPWATLQKANSSVGAGATVHVAPGNYYISSGISTSKSGTSTAPITWLSDTRWGAKILANSTIDTCWDNTGSNVVIEGFDISESTSGSCRIGLLNEGSNVRVSSNRVHDLTKAAAIVTCDGGPGAAGIDAYSPSASGADIVGNVVFHIGDYTNHSCRFIQGIYTAMKNVRVMNNVTYQNMSFGLNMGANSSSNTIANNTAFANGYGGLFLDTYSTNAVVVNNILYNNNTQGINCYSPGPVTIANNLIYGHSSPFQNNGSCSQSGTITSAPVFVNYQANGSGDYHLAAGSPGMDKGTSTGAPKVDFMGGARPMGSGYDVGAYETGNTPAKWPW